MSWSCYFKKQEILSEVRKCIPNYMKKWNKYFGLVILVFKRKKKNPTNKPLCYYT